MEQESTVAQTSTHGISSSLEAGVTSYEYDVFLSFRGDIRRGFVSHLHNALIIGGFRVYLDEREMHKGEEINEDLKRAIVNSKVCMPIFSKNYASSKACLFELSHMVQNKKKLIPVFYDVTPDDVKLKTPLYTKDLEVHVGNPRVGREEVEKWEEALLAAAKKSGYDLLNKYEAEEITKITKELFIKLMPKHQYVTDKFVEIDSDVERVEKLLEISSDGFRIVGIYGMGGIGKTTLAKAIFNQLKSSFSSHCSFLENVREKVEGHKLLELQRQLYMDIINPFYTNSIHNSNDGIEMIRKGLENKKVLLVLDDMNEADQLAKLLGNCLCFTSGSRLIITTRDREVLDGLNEKHIKVLQYQLQEMDGGRALKLFSKHAFREDCPPNEFQNISKEVVSYTGGFPLALEVFGSLFSRHSEDKWKGTLERLKRFPHRSIKDKLMISYEGLECYQQNIFLDIASYYGNLKKEYACYMWDDYGWYAEHAIKTLKDLSLIKIINTGSEHFWMHDVLKDLGRALIQADGEKSDKVPSRLRIDSSLDNLHEKKEKAHVEMLTIHAPNIIITREDLVGLQKLRFLELNVQKVEGDFDGLFPNLRWFCCSKAGEFKQINFNTKKLLVLELSVSDSTQNLEDWNAIDAEKLKVLDVSRPVHKFLRHLEGKLFEAQSDALWLNWKLMIMMIRIVASRSNPLSHGGDGRDLNLHRILNATDLEKLSLRLDYPITGLEEMGGLSRLRDLQLSDVKFQCLPHLPSSLLHLTLSCCEFVQEILDVSNLKNLIFLKILCPSNLKEIEGLGELYSLEVLSLQGMPILNDVWLFEKDISPWTYPENLKELDISCCGPLRELPGVSNLKRLCSLRLLWCGLVRTVKSFNGLESLTLLFVWNCMELSSLPDLSTLRRLRCLKLLECHKLERIEGIPNLNSLEIVQINDCNSLHLSDDDLAKLENVRSVYISNCRMLHPICKGPQIPSVNNSFLPLRLVEPISRVGNAIKQAVLRRINEIWTDDGL